MGSCLRKLISVIGVAVFIAGCSGGSSQSSSDAAPNPTPNPTPDPAGYVVSGSVGDGPIVGADIVVRDANGDVVLETSSDATARYSIEIPADTPLPITVTATGGTDLVTGRAADFELATAIFATGDQTTNVSPITTLAVRGVECIGQSDQATLDRVQAMIANTLSMGLDRNIDPVNADVGPENAAQFVLANEALGEVVRRSANSLANAGENINGDAVLTQIACDLAADEILDGVGPAVSPRTIVTFRAAESGVLFETLAGQLHVEGADATALMDMAVSTLLGQPVASVATVAPTGELVAQTLASLRLFQTNFDDQELVDVLLLMTGDDPVDVAASVTQGFDTAHQNLLVSLSDRAALTDDSTIDDITQRMADQQNVAAPTVSFSASNNEVETGAATTLTWTTTAADRCFGTGGWSGEVDLEGSTSTGPLDQSTLFNLTCTGLGGTTEQTETVAVPGTDLVPTLQMSVSDSSVVAGDVVVVTWASENTTQCTASGNWSGTRATNGSQQQGPLSSDQVYALECSGPGGSTTASVSVAVSAPPLLPAVNLSANPNSVPAGGSTELTWTSTNATSCVASNAWNGPRSADGTETIGSLAQTATFVITCAGAGGTASASVTVAVDAPPTPVVTVTATDSSVDYLGSTTLTWSATNATACVASDGWSGSKSLDGSETTSTLTQATTFILTCTGPGGTASDAASVNVLAAPAPTVSITAADSTVAPGSSTILSWTATNATTCTASGGWTGSRSLQGSESTPALQQTATFVLTCSGAGGSASDSVTVNLLQPDAPIVSISATTASVDFGASTTLSWASSNADSCTASNGWTGSRSLEGTATTGALTQATTFVLTCSGAGGTASDSVTVNVLAPPAPTVSITTADDTIDYDTATSLTWSSTNATSCSASGSWSGTRPLSGTQATGALQQTATFAITCSGSGGTASDSVTVNVLAPPAPTVSIAAATSSVDFGAATSLTWSSSNATSCVASDGWSGARATSGTEATGALQLDTTFVITCSGVGGTASGSVTVNVLAPPAPEVSLAAADNTIDFDASTALTWSSSNATSCVASDGWSGSRSLSGTETTAALQLDTTFVITCSGVGGTASDSVTVSVLAPPAPEVSLAAADNTVDFNSSTSLTWSSANASTCSASGDWSGTRTTSGNESVGPLTESQSYTLTCTGAGGSTSASVDVTVSTGPEPTVDMSVADSVVDAGASTTITWSSQNATTCTASGDWSGSKAVSGTESTAALQAGASYSLTCDGPGGSALAIVSVAVRQVVDLSWDAPTQNEDGTPLVDLTGFRLYVGDTSGSYDTPIEISGAGQTSHPLTLDPGVYYVVVRAVTAGGEESDNSNEVQLTVQ